MEKFARLSGIFKNVGEPLRLCGTPPINQRTPYTPQ